MILKSFLHCCWFLLLDLPFALEVEFPRRMQRVLDTYQISRKYSYQYSSTYSVNLFFLLYESPILFSAPKGHLALVIFEVLVSLSSKICFYTSHDPPLVCFHIFLIYLLISSSLFLTVSPRPTISSLMI